MTSDYICKDSRPSPLPLYQRPLPPSLLRSVGDIAKPYHLYCWWRHSPDCGLPYRRNTELSYICLSLSLSLSPPPLPISISIYLPFSMGTTTRPPLQTMLCDGPHGACPEMEFLNASFNQGFFSDSNVCLVFYPRFLFYKMLFADFLCSFKTRLEYGFL